MKITAALFLADRRGRYCGGESRAAAPAGPAPEGPVRTARYRPTVRPRQNLLYVDHYGTFYIYRLPLAQGSKPERTLTEWPGLDRSHR